MIRSLSAADAETVVHAIMVSRLDYCNALLYGVADGLMRRLQSVQNAAARLLSGVRRCDHISPTLIATTPLVTRVTARSIKHCCPRLPVSDRTSTVVPLRSGSSDIRMLSVPATHNRFGDRSFTAAGPRLWNEQLPADLRRPNLTFPAFKQKLKTYLFGLACS